jgi:hypothetical protein
VLPTCGPQDNAPRLHHVDMLDTRGQSQVHWTPWPTCIDSLAREGAVPDAVQPGH